MTDYILLQQHDSEEGAETWVEVGVIAKASSPKRALATSDLSAGHYVAVPVRSWRPLEVKVEQTTKVTIG